jgi:hypothetical protein
LFGRTISSDNQHGHAHKQKNKKFVLCADVDSSVDHCWASDSSLAGSAKHYRFAPQMLLLPGL